MSCFYIIYGHTVQWILSVWLLAGNSILDGGPLPIYSAKSPPGLKLTFISAAGRHAKNHQTSPLLYIAGFHQNGGGPPRAVSPMSVDGGPATKPGLAASGGRSGGGNEGRGSPSPSLVSEKTLTEAELQVRVYAVEELSVHSWGWERRRGSRWANDVSSKFCFLRSQYAKNFARLLQYLRKKSKIQSFYKFFLILAKMTKNYEIFFCENLKCEIIAKTLMQNCLNFREISRE